MKKPHEDKFKTVTKDINIKRKYIFFQDKLN